jgi:hypothetical protein
MGTGRGASTSSLLMTLVSLFRPPKMTSICGGGRQLTVVWPMQNSSGPDSGAESPALLRVPPRPPPTLGARGIRIASVSCSGRDSSSDGSGEGDGGRSVAVVCGMRGCSMCECTVEVGEVCFVAGRYVLPAGRERAASGYRRTSDMKREARTGIFIKRTFTCSHHAFSTSVSFVSTLSACISHNLGISTGTISLLGR